MIKHPGNRTMLTALHKTAAAIKAQRGITVRHGTGLSWSYCFDWPTWAYLGVTDALAMLRLLPMSDRTKDAELLALRHQVAPQSNVDHEPNHRPDGNAWLPESAADRR